MRIATARSSSRGDTADTVTALSLAGVSVGLEMLSDMLFSASSLHAVMATVSLRCVGAVGAAAATARGSPALRAVCEVRRLSLGLRAASAAEWDFLRAAGASTVSVVDTNARRSPRHLAACAAMTAQGNCRTAEYVVNSASEVRRLQRAGVVGTGKGAIVLLRVSVSFERGTGALDANRICSVARAARRCGSRLGGVSLELGTQTLQQQMSSGREDGWPSLAIELARSAYDHSSRVGSNGGAPWRIDLSRGRHGLLPAHRSCDANGGVGASLGALLGVRRALCVLFPEERVAVTADVGPFLFRSAGAVAVRVNGERVRGEVKALYLSDGFYGAFSHAQPGMGLETGAEECGCDNERDDEVASSAPRSSVVLFGPTCDSLDKIPVGFAPSAAGDAPLVVSRGGSNGSEGSICATTASTGDWLCFTGIGGFAGVAKCEFNGFHGAVEVEEI